MEREDGSGLGLRKYQELIAMQALHANTIAFLPTGMGKTFVALYVLKQRLLAKQSNPTVAKIAILVAPKKALVSQHVRTIRTTLSDLKINELNGESKSKRTGRSIDFWTREDWLLEIQSFDVLVMTSAVCRDLVERRYIPSDALDCLILDECHSATGNDEMARLCDIMNTSQYKPLILGLTASPIKGKRGHAMQAIIELEERMNSTFFVPTEEFFQSLDEFKITAGTVIVHHEDSIESFSTRDILGYWESTIKAFANMSSYIQDLKEYDENFGTNFMEKLVAEVSGGMMTSVPFCLDQRLSLWRKIIQQALQMTRSVGPIAGSLSAKESIAEQLRRRRGALLLLNQQEEGRTRKHRNDKSVQDDRCADVIKICKAMPSREFSLSFLQFACDQPRFILYLLLEMATCMMRLMGISLEDFQKWKQPDVDWTGKLRKQTVSWISDYFYSDPSDRFMLWSKVTLLIWIEVHVLTLLMVQFLGRFTSFIESDSVVQVAHDIFVFIHRTALNHMSFNSKRITKKTMCLLDVLCAILSNTGSEPTSNFRARQRETWPYCLQMIGPDATQFEPFRIPFSEWKRLIGAVEGGNNSIIVFCDMKLATAALDELFIKFWSTLDTIVPPSAFLHGGMSIETQKSILDRFKKGIIRVLFASEVAEEGIDIGKCRFVVHFDPPKTVKSQIQRRGRARAAQAQLIHIWPDINTEEYGELEKTFAKFHRDELKMSSVVQEFTAITREVARALCGAPNGAGMRETVTRFGHTIDVISAQTLVVQYCQALYRRRRRSQHEDDTDISTTAFQPYYVFHRLSPALFEAKLHLPWEKMTHLAFHGRPEFVIQAASKRLAQGLAAIAAVRWLLSVEELDEQTLRPVMSPIVRVAGVDLDVDIDESDENQGCEWSQKTVPDTLLPPKDFPVSGLRLYQYRIVIEKVAPKGTAAAADHQNDSDGDESDGDGDGGGEGGGDVEDGVVDISAFVSERQAPLGATAPPQQSYSKRRRGHQFLSSLEDIVILTAQEVVSRSDCDDIDGFLLTVDGDEQPREASIAGEDAIRKPQQIVRYEYLGERVVSYAELLWIQRFHTAIVQVDCFLPDIVGSDQCPLVRREEDGFFDIDSIRQECMRFDDGSINAYELLTCGWKNWKNSACYWICPLAPVGCDHSLMERTLMDAVLEAELLVKNCQWIQARNAQRRPVMDIVVDPVRPRADFVYTSTGNALFRYKSFVTSWSTEDGHQLASLVKDAESLSSEQSSTATSVYPPSKLTRRFDDVMKVHGAQVITYARHYRRSDHKSRQHFLDQIEREQDARNPFASTLFRGHSLSGKFTLHNYLQPPQGPQHERELEEPVDLGSDFIPPAEIFVPSSSSSVSTLTASLTGGAPPPQPPPPPSSSWNFFAPAFSLPVGHLKWYRLILAVPSVLARFQSIVMAKEVQQRVFGAMAAACGRPTPRISTVLTTITNTRALENISNERLEFLGDSFLKYAATVYVLQSALLDNNPQLMDKILTAEMMTEMRQALLTNKTLSERMDALGILHYLRVIPICRGREQLELALPDGRLGGTTRCGLRNVNIQANQPLVLATVPIEAQQIATKTFSEGVPRKVRADFLEALLGAAVVATTSTASSKYDLALAWQAFLQLNLIGNTSVAAPPALSGFVQPKWHQLLAAAPWRAQYRTDEEDIARKLQPILRHDWSDPALARLAVTHPSVIAAMNVSVSGRFPQHYDVLEFVGDAVLDFVVVQELFRRHPTWDESLLTAAKVALVNNNFLGTVATRCGLPALIRHGDMEVFREAVTQSLQALDTDDASDNVSALAEPTQNLSLADHNRREQHSSPIRHPTMSRPSTSPLPPSAPQTPSTPETAVEVFAAPVVEFSCSDKERKMRADVFEALIGAVFIDSAGDLNVVQQVLHTMGYWRSVETYSQHK